MIANIICKTLNRSVWLLFLLSTGSEGAENQEHCKGGYVIGEDANQFYCSKKSCAELKGQVKKDQEALRRLQKSIEDSNQELQDWTKQNDVAQKAVLKDASKFLVDTTIGALGDHFQGKLDSVEKEFSERAPMGETWNRKIEKVRELRVRSMHLSAITDGISLAQYPAMNVADAWSELKTWAHDAKHDAHVIDSTIKEFKKDPEVRNILKENSLDFVSDGLKLALNSVTQKGLDLGTFIVNYGYDTSSWLASRERIMQNIALDEQNLNSVCALSRQLQITVRDNNVCHGKYPDPKYPPPEAVTCVKGL